MKWCRFWASWCCGSRSLEELTFIQIGSGHTVCPLINKILVFKGFFLCSLSWGSLCGFRDCNGKEGENNLLQNWTVEQTTCQKPSSLLLFLKQKTCDFFQICEQKGLKIMNLFASLYLEGICKDKRLNADLKLKSSCIHN